MFSAYFTQSYFPDGWGVLGTQPEGSMSGVARVALSATASRGAIVWRFGSSLLSLAVSGDLTEQPEQTGAAFLGVTATGTLTFTGEAESSGGMYYVPVRRRWATGKARVSVVASGALSSVASMVGMATVGLAASGTASARSIAVIPTVQVAAVTFQAPVKVTLVRAAHPASVVSALMMGTAHVSVFADGVLTAVAVEGPPPPAYDDSDDIATFLMLLEAA